MCQLYLLELASDLRYPDLKGLFIQYLCRYCSEFNFDKYFKTDFPFLQIWFQNKRARWRRLASAGKLHPSPPTNIPSDSFSKKQEIATSLTYSDVPQHHLSENYPNQSVNYATPYMYNCNYQAPQAKNSHIQQAITNLMYSSADAASQLPSPFHAVTSLYQQIANSPYSYSAIWWRCLLIDISLKCTSVLI